MAVVMKDKIKPKYMLELTQADLSTIDKHIQEMPFKFGFPLFQFFRKKLEEKNPKGQAVQSIEEAANKMKVVKND